MGRSRTLQAGITKIDVALILVAMAILSVVAVPRYNRQSMTAEAKSLISTMQAAAEKIIQDVQASTPDKDMEGLPSDEQLLQALEKRLGGKIPPNPFTKNNQLVLKHHASLSPCDCLDQEGGWVWNLVSLPGKNRPHKSLVWLNSDTVHIEKGNGESCIQP